MKRAVLIGINDYANLPPYSQLKGCTNDVQLLQPILERRYGFKKENTKILLNSDATRDAILAAMKELVELSTAEDSVVFHFSGHGSQRTAESLDEPDGLDETIMPHDTGRDELENRDITNNVLRDWRRALCAKTAWVTLIFDCCHSGTIVRSVVEGGGESADSAAFGLQARSVSPDRRTHFPPINIDFRTSGNHRGAELPPISERNYVLMAGCRPDEYSFEHQHSESAENVTKFGAMTYHLCQELQSAEAGTTFRDVFGNVRSKVAGVSKNRQHPQLQGRLDRELFGTREVKPMRFVSITGRQGDSVTLASGGALGVTVGSRYSVYPANAKRMVSEEQLGVIEVNRVQGVTSEAKVVEEVAEGAIVELARAVEDGHAPHTRVIRVALAAECHRVESAATIEASIANSSLLEIVPVASQADYLVKSISSSDNTPGVTPLESDAWGVFAADQSLAMPLIAQSDANAATQLVAKLEQWARYQRVLQLEHPFAEHSLKGKIRVSFLKADPQGEWKSATLSCDAATDAGETIYRNGDRLAFEIENKSNQELFIHLLDLEHTGAITLIYPFDGSEEALLPGKVLQIGVRDGDEFELELDETGLPPHATSALESVRVFATTAPADFQLSRPAGSVTLAQWWNSVE